MLLTFNLTYNMEPKLATNDVELSFRKIFDFYEKHCQNLNSGMTEFIRFSIKSKREETKKTN